MDKFYLTLNNAEKKIFERIRSRLESRYPLRRYAHFEKFNKILKLFKKNDTILDVGRGGSVDGILGIWAAKEGYRVTITNPMEQNLNVLKKYAEYLGLGDRIQFRTENPEALSFNDNSFDVVLSLHVLEHLDDMDKGFYELHRVSKERVIIALPTCFNLAAFSRLGGTDFYRFKPLCPLSIIWGSLRFLYHLLRGDESVNEKMNENGKTIIHRWWFPWRMKKMIKNYNFKILKFEPDAICLPWFSIFIPFMRFLDKHSQKGWLRFSGLGSHVLLAKE